MQPPIKFSRPPPKISGDMSSMQRGTGSPDRVQIDIGWVGYTADDSDWPEDTPAWIRFEQGEPIVEVELRAGDKITARIGLPPTVGLSAGQQVVVAFPDGDPEMAVIIATMAGSYFPTPSSIAGISTGADAATAKGTRIPATTFQFMRLLDGRALAIQTTGTGDILIHSGASVHLKCSTANAAGAPAGAIHLDGQTHLGAAPLEPPTASEVAPGGDEIPGAPMVPFVPEPYSSPGPAAPVPVPYTGFANGIVRAKDAYQSSAATDVDFWAWVTLINGLAGNPDPAPTVMTSYVSGANGAGSKHTANGEPVES